MVENVSRNFVMARTAWVGVERSEKRGNLLMQFDSENESVDSTRLRLIKLRGENPFDYES